MTEKFECPECGKVFKVLVICEGEIVECPDCETEFKINGDELEPMP